MKKILFLVLFANLLMASARHCESFNKVPKKSCIKKDANPVPFKYTLPKLPYAYDALEPYIDARTMEIHYTKHHQKYVDDLNKTLENYPNLLGKPVEYLLEHLNEIPEAIRTNVINFGGGHLNHSMFWLMMTPKARKQPQGALKQAITQQFGSFNKFKEEFNKASRELFGSGYAWLCLNKDKKLVIIKSKDQDNPISIGLKPVLCLDVWEHAYYLKHQNLRVDYIDVWWNVTNWDYVEKNYNEAMI